MSCTAVSSIDGSIAAELDEERSFIEELAKKTHSIWAGLYDLTIGNCIRIVHIVRSAIGAVIRNALFFPLKCSLITNVGWIRQQLRIEEEYYRDFWDPSKPVDPSMRNHAEIRERFASPVDHVIPIRLKDGKAAEITCRVIQTKEEGDNFYNFIQVPGVYTTIGNNIGTTHPYLDAYINGENDIPARFICLSLNDLNIHPATMDETGFIILETLKALKEKFGKIDQVVAHSLGTVFFANALKQLEDPSLLPKYLCLDRGPTSLWEASKHYLCGLGALVYLLAKVVGWSADVEADVVAFCQKWDERPSLLVTGVVQDHHFGGSANLCFGETIKKLDNVDFLIFDPPRQLFHQTAHHNLRPDFFNTRYLVGESDYLSHTENLPEAILRHSMQERLLQAYSMNF